MSQIWGQITQLKRKSTTLQLVSYMLSQPMTHYDYDYCD